MCQVLGVAILCSVEGLGDVRVQGPIKRLLSWGRTPPFPDDPGGPCLAHALLDCWSVVQYYGADFLAVHGLKDLSVNNLNQVPVFRGDSDCGEWHVANSVMILAAFEDDRFLADHYVPTCYRTHMGVMLLSHLGVPKRH